MKAIILCAGFGTRLYPLTLEKPKSLLEINGKPLLSYIIEKIPVEVDQIFIASNDKFYTSFIWWLSGQDKNIKEKVEVINNGVLTNETRLGGIGDLDFIIKSKNIDDDLLVILGDNFFSFPLERFIGYFKKLNKTMTGVFEFDKEKASKFGVVEVDNDNRILAFEEKPAEPKTNLVSIGIYIFPKENLEIIHDYMKTNLNKDGPGYLVKYLTENNEVYAYKFEGEWHDIGSIEEYENLK